MGDSNTSTEPPSQVERRRSPRIPVEMWVEESTDRELYFQRGANISVGGLYLERTIPHAVGTHINLRFTLPGDDGGVNVSGEIVDSGDPDDDGLGMHVKFVELDPADRARIERFVERAAAERGLR